MQRTATIIVLAALVASCGTKGPLFLPTQPQPSAPSVSPTAEQSDDSKASPIRTVQ